MKFDVIVSNPPYNNCMYISFGNKLYELLSEHGELVMITPAGFMGDGKQSQLLARNGIDKYQRLIHGMRDIVFYRNSREIFDIVLAGEKQNCAGIAHYLIENNKRFNVKKITEHLYEGSIEEYESFSEDCTINLNDTHKGLCNKMLRFVENQAAPPAFYFDKNWFNTTTVDYAVLVENCACIEGQQDGYRITKYGNAVKKVGVKYGGIKHREHVSSYKCYFSKRAGCIGVFGVVVCGPNELVNSKTNFLIYIGTYDECLSVKSWYESRLMVYMCVSNLLGFSFNREALRYVPYPVAVDHAWCDAELYEMYGITAEERALIENLNIRVGFNTEKETVEYVYSNNEHPIPIGLGGVDSSFYDDEEVDDEW